jgi:hypothetical protein
MVNYLKEKLEDDSKFIFDYQKYSPVIDTMNSLNEKNLRGITQSELYAFMKQPHLDFIKTTFDFCELKLVYRFDYETITTIYKTQKDLILQLINIINENFIEERSKTSSTSFISIYPDKHYLLSRINSIIEELKENNILLKDILKKERITICSPFSELNEIITKKNLTFIERLLQEFFINTKEILKNKKISEEDQLIRFQEYLNHWINQIFSIKNFNDIIQYYFSLHGRMEKYHKEKKLIIEDPFNFFIGIETILWLQQLNNILSTTKQTFYRKSILLHKKEYTMEQFQLLKKSIDFFEEGDKKIFREIIEALGKLNE